MPATAIILPVFNDRASLLVLLRAIAALPDAKVWRLCIVDDGSTIDPPQAADLGMAGLTGVVLRLCRNMGHQAAIACGIGYVAAQWPEADAVIMDADGEDRPQDIAALLACLDRAGLHAVVAVRRRRTESLGFRIGYAVYKRLFRLLSGQAMQFGNFMALSAPALRRLASMTETWTHVAAALIASRLPIRRVPTDRGTRYAGRSSMNLVSLSVHAARGLMVFADIVLMRLILACVALVGVAALLGLLAIGLKVTGNATPGWFTSAFGLLVLLVVQMAGIFAVSLVLLGVSRGGVLRNAASAHRDCIAATENAP